MDYKNIFKEISEGLESNVDGEVASYIPELSLVNPDKFGVFLSTLIEGEHGFGDAEEKFSIQSVSKVLTLVMAYQLEGGNLWTRVGVEPSGTPFNSLVQLEHDLGIPRNPFINAGAIVVCDVLISQLENPKTDLLTFARKLAQNSSIEFSSKVVASEKSMSYRNSALINLMKSYGNIENEIEEVMDFYFHLCSIEMTCKELAHTFKFLATNGIIPSTKQVILSPSKTKRINAIMQTCGFYDEAGEFSFKVGLPGKSGVGGGIVAVHPGHYSIAVWSPRLNTKGNSHKGMKFLEKFTTKTESSIF